MRSPFLIPLDNLQIDKNFIDQSTIIRNTILSKILYIYCINYFEINLTHEIKFRIELISLKTLCS